MHYQREDYGGGRDDYHQGGFGGGGSDEVEIEIPQGCVGRIIGKGGSKIRELQDDTGARIKIDKDKGGHGSTAYVMVSGSADSIAMARQQIEDIASQDSRGGGGYGGRGGGGGGFGGRGGGGYGGGGYQDFNSGPQLEFTVDNTYVGKIIGKGGSKIRELQDHSNCRIKIHKDDGNPYAKVIISGEEGSQMRARQMIEALCVPNDY